jgi:hypothetical protein
VIRADAVAALYRVAAALGLGLLGLMLVGCGSVPLETTPPPGFNLSGSWRLVPELSDPAPRTRALRSRGIGLAFASQDFPVLTAERLLIEQNRDSMGVQYDGSDYRDVSWGERQRGLWQVNAGWQEGVLMILSEAPDGEAMERIWLEEGGSRLIVEVTVTSAGETLTRTRTFERVVVGDR